MVPYRRWMPGSHTLLFNTRLDFEEGLGLYLSDDLHALDVDSGTNQPLLPPGEGGDFYLSPDGSQVALVTSLHPYPLTGCKALAVTNRAGMILVPVAVTGHIV